MKLSDGGGGFRTLTRKTITNAGSAYKTALLVPMINQTKMPVAVDA